MMRRLIEKLIVLIPDAHVKSFQASIVSDNLTRLIIGGATLSVVEMGVFAAIRNLAVANYYFPLIVIIFNLAMIPVFIILRRREERTGLKRALIYLSVLFYLAWSCSFTWSNRAVNPEFGMNILFSAYLLMVYGVAIVIYLEPVWSAAIFLMSLGMFIAMIPFDELSRREISINIWNAVALNIFAWLTSRILFAFRLRAFSDNRQIHEKNSELETERNNLKDALANVKQLSGLLPICSNCKKVRNDSGYWEQVEQYISERSEATFTHGLCPDCMKKMYPGMDK